MKASTVWHCWEHQPIFKPLHASIDQAQTIAKTWNTRICFRERSERPWSISSNTQQVLCLDTPMWGGLVFFHQPQLHWNDSGAPVKNLYKHSCQVLMLYWWTKKSEGGVRNRKWPTGLEEYFVCWFLTSALRKSSKKWNKVHHQAEPLRPASLIKETLKKSVRLLTIPSCFLCWQK